MDEKFDVLNKYGQFTGKTATRSECHKKGLWHRAVYAFIIDEDFNILLQKRSDKKDLWPNKWDVTVGGHVDAGELGRQALKRECKEELGIDILDSDIKFLVSSTSVYKNGNYYNRHYDEGYLIIKKVDPVNLKINEEEVSSIRYFSKEELLKRINDNYDGLTEKIISWQILKTLLENEELKKSIFDIE